jgi:hypothetical protein
MSASKLTALDNTRATPSTPVEELCAMQLDDFLMDTPGKVKPDGVVGLSVRRMASFYKEEATLPDLNSMLLGESHYPQNLRQLFPGWHRGQVIGETFSCLVIILLCLSCHHLLVWILQNLCV